MTQLKLTLVKSFTQDELQGNPVGVCLKQVDCHDDVYFSITRQTGFSECVFIKFVDNVPVLRFFSPEKEMNMCGHAVLAAAHVLQGEYQPTLLRTKAGDVAITCRADGFIEMMIKAEPVYFNDFVSKSRIAELLGISVTAIKEDPVKISVGTPKILLELNSPDDLLLMRPNFQALAQEIPEGIYPFVKIREECYYARQFNPASGIQEDPVTGIAAGALGVHLRGKNIGRFVVEQGHVLNKRGTIFVDVTDGIKIGGYATIYDEVIFDI